VIDGTLLLEGPFG